MSWRVEFLAQAAKDIEKLDRQVGRRIARFLFKRVAGLEDPRSIGEALRGTRFGEAWKYRVGDYRVICRIEDTRLLVLVVRIGHRREIYR
jgi:mRNA interferase RelE/StbE